LCPVREECETFGHSGGSTSQLFHSIGKGRRVLQSEPAALLILVGTPVTLLLTCHMTGGILMWSHNMSEILQGTLDLMVLKTLDAMGPLHGYGIARRIEQVSGDVLQLNQGTIYASLLRLQQKSWIAADWGVSENNRKAKFYSLTRAGRKQLASEAESWEQIAGVIGRLLQMEPKG
jgi:PadR family transcriptional regulator, regulatory protein PadR